MTYLSELVKRDLNDIDYRIRWCEHYLALPPYIEWGNQTYLRHTSIREIEYWLKKLKKERNRIIGLAYA